MLKDILVFVKDSLTKREGEGGDSGGSSDLLRFVLSPVLFLPSSFSLPT